jgi:PAS domain S-box-containing protein
MAPSEDQLRTILDSIPALAWAARPDGSAEFFNRRWLDYTGLSAEQARDWTWTTALHPDDLNRLTDYWRSILDSGEPGEIEARLRRFDGEYRWFLFRASPSRDQSGKVVKWYGTNTDIDDRKRAEDALRASEHNFRLIVDSIPGLVCTMTAAGEVEFLNPQVLEYFGKTAEEMKGWATSDAIHPDDLPGVIAVFTNSVAAGRPYDIENRYRRADGVYRWFEFRTLPARDAAGRIIRWYGLLIDIDDRKRAEAERSLAEEDLRKSEERWRAVFENSAIGVALADLSGRFLATNSAYQKMLGYTDQELGRLTFLEITHEDYRESNWQLVTELIDGKRRQFQIEKQLRRRDGSLVWVSNNVSLVPGSKSMPRFVMALSEDITERKQIEEKLRESEAILLEAQQLSHTGSWMHDPKTGRTSQSPELLRIFGVNPNEEDASSGETFIARIHPEDAPIEAANYARARETKADFEGNYRIILPDGSIKRIRNVAHPRLDESGNLLGFVGMAMDVTEQWQARAKLEKAFDEIKSLKDRLHDENLALREQIDQGFMFEEIVGSSPALQKVLSSIVMVAPTDSTVLITGETGTGKELIARAIHKRSQRAGQAFISVNCASIPAALIASELFGHEKGAFTGALQRRQGRFELAHSGTIFLDEIGELPAETQVALLRVLQEREFERVGGNRPLKTDVRVIAATNRNLPTAVASGIFRSDLYYRLNVFPIEVPPLRQRKEDIPMLVEYFVKRYAEKARKLINKIDKSTLKQCQSYPWPGNIRELQNVVERSVIVSSGEVFSIDESWLSREPSQPAYRDPQSHSSETEPDGEREMIEAALAESRGRVAGPQGAAAKLRIPPTTLYSRIRALKISKSQFKFG